MTSVNDIAALPQLDKKDSQDVEKSAVTDVSYEKVDVSSDISDVLDDEVVIQKAEDVAVQVSLPPSHSSSVTEYLHRSSRLAMIPMYQFSRSDWSSWELA